MAETHETVVSTRFRGDPDRTHQFPIPYPIKHAGGTQDRRLLRFYESDRDFVYHAETEQQRCKHKRQIRRRCPELKKKKRVDKQRDLMKESKDLLIIFLEQTRGGRKLAVKQ
ncbi:hypothetical protein MTR_7g111220 [Medicago truncatula]|uniref:Uncharacterized protein n=1 Tax=Medicago truncatula TaxID=3880 RepID=Q2HUY9_MEDTR|nr:hypothetical protein MtrDRAFT_AC149038g23v2 [Medicago truncatula]AES82336.1 hypothetical protein MTR_7g111220 [Medicago truncatula]